MKKMMFNDRYGLTDAVIQKRKTVTRRIVTGKMSQCWLADCKDRDFQLIVEKNNLNAYTSDKELYYSFGLPYKAGEIVAVAQCYKDAGIDFMPCDLENHRKWGCTHRMKAWLNKMFVIANLMPHQIRILDVRAEKLQDITEEDCLREGIIKYTKDKTVYKYDLDDGFEMFLWRDMKRTPQETFAALIDKISGKGTWKSNPFVWRIEFELIDNP